MEIEITQILSDFVSSQILKQPDRKLAPDSRLISSGLIDSLSLVDLAIFVEDHFGVRIDDTELNGRTFDTLGELAGIIQARQSH